MPRNFNVVDIELTDYKKSPTNFVLNERAKKCLYVSLFLIGLITVGLICGLIINSINNDTNTTNTTNTTPIKCRILQKNEVRPYPNSNKNTYYISFNREIMQADYVKYIQPNSTNSCRSCSYFKIDPYDINTLRNDDYTNTGYDRGHLVPNADFGNDTYIISNAVPMNPYFNQRIWSKVEQMIRDNYKNKLVYKGCTYSNQYITTKNIRKLYIPLGCSYAVFDSNDVNQTSDLILLDFGYLENNNMSDVKKIEKVLPKWTNC